MKRPTDPDTSLPVLWLSSLQCDITATASPPHKYTHADAHTHFTATFRESGI